MRWRYFWRLATGVSTHERRTGLEKCQMLLSSATTIPEPRICGCANYLIPPRRRYRFRWSWHAESMFAHLTFSERKFVSQAMLRIKRGDKGAGFYVARGSSALGLIGLATGEAWLSEGGCYATCFGWFIHPGYDVRFWAARSPRCCLSRASAGQSPEGPQHYSSMVHMEEISS